MSHELMSDRVRDVGDGIILGFPIAETDVAGQSIDTTRLYFFRVGSETRYFQKYTALGSVNSGATLPTSGYGFLGDTGMDNGSDIFRMSTDDWHLMHFGVGTNHPDVEVFYAVSPKANGDPAQDRTGTGEDITPGTDDRGWFTGKQVSDRWDPPAWTERVAFRNDKDGEFLLWAIHNDASVQLSGNELDLFFTGRGYKVQPVTDPDMQELMLTEALQRRENPAIDTVLHQVGGINDYTLGTEEPDQWKAVRNGEGFTRDFNVTELTADAEQLAATARV